VRRDGHAARLQLLAARWPKAGLERRVPLQVAIEAALLQAEEVRHGFWGIHMGWNLWDFGKPGWHRLAEIDGKKT